MLEKKSKYETSICCIFHLVFKNLKIIFENTVQHFVDFSVIYLLAPFPHTPPHFSGLNPCMHIIFYLVCILCIFQVCIFFLNAMFQQSTSLSSENISGKAARICWLSYELTRYEPFVDLFTTYFAISLTCKNKLKYLKIFKWKHCVFIISLVPIV